MTTETSKAPFLVTYTVGETYVIELMAEDEMDACRKASQIWSIDRSLFQPAGPFENQTAHYAPIDVNS